MTPGDALGVPMGIVHRVVTPPEPGYSTHLRVVVAMPHPEVAMA